MKRLLLVSVLCAMSAFAAFGWEGNATVIPEGDLPGHSIATNVLPKNTVVDITNLENYRTLRVIVVADLESSGLLATVSRSAAEALDIQDNSVYRVFLKQPSDEIAYSYLKQLGLVPAAEIRETPAEYPGYSETELLAASETDDFEDGLSLVPTEEKVPEGDEYTIASEHMVDPIAEQYYTEEPYEYAYISEIEAAPDTAAYQAPLITNLERNRWYVQIAAYSRYDYVENEISRIGAVYPEQENIPLAIQNAGSDSSPVYRVLLGPMNQGESAAILQRVRSVGYHDAFVRQNQ